MVSAQWTKSCSISKDFNYTDPVTPSLEAYLTKVEAKGKPETSEIIDHLTWRHIQSSKFIFRLRSIITLKSKIWRRHEAVYKEQRYCSEYS